MPQAFQKKTVFMLKLALLAGLLSAGAPPRWIMAPEYVAYDTVPQPIPFSHKHHVDDDGLDCRYCHTTVEQSAFAGMPSCA